MESMRKFYKPCELIGITGLSKSGVYKALNDNRIKSIRVGKRILVPTWAVEELIQEAKQAQA